MYPKSVLSLLFPTFLLCIFIFIWKLSEPADWQSEKTSSSNCFTPQMPTMGRAKQGWSQGPKIPPGYPIWVAGAQVPGWLSAASRSAHQQGAGIRSRAETWTQDSDMGCRLLKPDLNCHYYFLHLLFGMGNFIVPTWPGKEYFETWESIIGPCEGASR